MRIFFACPENEGKNLLFATLALVFLAHLPALATPLFIDDEALVRGIVEKIPWGDAWGAFLPRRGEIYYRPLDTLSRVFYGKLLGGSLAPYRLLNLFWHFACALLLCRLARSFKDSGKFYPYAAGALFAAYPASVAVTANLSQTMVAESAACLLAALVLHVRRGEGGAGGFAPAALFWLAGLLFYEGALLFLPLAFLVDLAGRGFFLRRSFRRILPYGLVLAAYLLFRIHFLGGFRGDVFHPSYGIPDPVRLFLWEIPGALVFPLNRYPIREVLLWPYLFLLLALLLYLFRKNAPGNRRLLLGVLWTLGAAWPLYKHMEFLEGNFHAFRYLYLPAAGLSLGAAALFLGNPEPPPRLGRRVLWCAVLLGAALSAWNSLGWAAAARESAAHLAKLREMEKRFPKNSEVFFLGYPLRPGGISTLGATGATLPLLIDPDRLPPAFAAGVMRGVGYFNYVGWFPDLLAALPYRARLDVLYQPQLEADPRREGAERLARGDIGGLSFIYWNERAGKFEEVSETVTRAAGRARSFSRNGETDLEKPGKVCRQWPVSDRSPEGIYRLEPGGGLLCDFDPLDPSDVSAVEVKLNFPGKGIAPFEAASLYWSSKGRPHFDEVRKIGLLLRPGGDGRYVFEVGFDPAWLMNDKVTRLLLVPAAAGGDVGVRGPVLLTRRGKAE